MDHAWPAQWLRGALALCALTIVERHGPLHGYAITQHLEAAGLGSIGGGTLYPLLGRFERDGLVSTTWVSGDNGPAKKLYSITAHGAAQLAVDAARWEQFCATTMRMVGRTHGKDQA